VVFGPYGVDLRQSNCGSALRLILIATALRTLGLAIVQAVLQKTI
jgi:hypothetical protein